MFSSNPLIDENVPRIPGDMQVSAHGAVNLWQECRTAEGAPGMWPLSIQPINQWFTIPII
jgi:hypothetical protein